MKKNSKHLKSRLILKLASMLVLLSLWACHENGNYREYDRQVESQENRLYDSVERLENEEYSNTDNEKYNKIYENQFYDSYDHPLSTFSIDVDNASYANVRRLLELDQLPSKDAVRIEEMVNYFNYDYPEPRGQHPFAFETEVAECPWNPGHKLVHIGIQGKSIDYDDLKPSNLVFLVDASGSMSDQNKLPLLKKALTLLINELNPEDKVAIVTYAGSAGLVLPSTPASEKSRILDALDYIESGGSTAGGEGIQLAYDIAREHMVYGGNNRVILATDGDFNVGVTSSEGLIDLIQNERDNGVYLTICGFGMGNYNDGTMEDISNAGNGNYFYIDNISEAKKVFVDEMRANLFTIAKDVKIQVEFNPKAVQSYRLIGFENRILNHQDFKNDQIDAGELGAGHTVTALYEIIPFNGGSTDGIKLKYQQKVLAKSERELMTLKFRYKPIDSDRSNLISTFINNSNTSFYRSSDNFKFSAAVAGFGMLLRDSEYKGNLSFRDILEWSHASTGRDREGHRAEFIRLVEIAKTLSQVNS